VVRTEGARQRRRVREARMIAMVILGPLEFHGAIDPWTEYLCMERLPDGSLELSSRSRESCEPIAVESSHLRSDE
jgi:hypothetical protein